MGTPQTETYLVSLDMESGNLAPTVGISIQVPHSRGTTFIFPSSVAWAKLHLHQDFCNATDTK